VYIDNFCWAQTGSPNARSGCNYIGGTGESQSDAAWLVPICIQVVPAIILFVGMIWMPFSPRWLMHHDREDEARTILANLRDLPPDHELIELEFLEIKAQSLFEKRSIAEHFPHLQTQTAMNIFKLQFVAIGALFKTKAMFRRVIVATVTMFFQQWSGINAVSFWPCFLLMLEVLANCSPRIPGVVLRPSDLWPTRFELDNDESAGNRCCWHCHVHCYHPCRSVD
jgi:hypothetical protein